MPSSSDLPPAPKRRRLDSSPNTTTHTPEPSSHARWLEAKASSAARRGRKVVPTSTSVPAPAPEDQEGGDSGREDGGREDGKAEADVYDDSNGAHKARVSSQRKNGVRSNSVDKKRGRKKRIVQKEGEHIPINDDEKEDAEEDVPTNDDEESAEEEEHLLPARSSARKRRTPAKFTDVLARTTPSRTADVLSSTTPSRTATRGRGKTFEEEIAAVERSAKREVVAERKAMEEVGVERSARKEVEVNGESTRKKRGEKVDSLARTTDVADTAVKRRGRKKISLEVPQLPVVHDLDQDDVEMDVVEEETPADEDTQTVTVTMTAKKPNSKSSPNASDAIFDSDQLRTIQTVVLEKCTQKRPIRLTYLNDEYAKVSSLVSQTVVAGESNSMLVIGARGSGKTTLIKKILREQALKHPGDFHVIRLSGFIHTDDKIALRDIWRQLGREMQQSEDDAGVSKSIADTLTTLLALLSHPAEHGLEQPDQMTKSVIFILDEFELFAGHPRQTLLYNLFDIAQSRKAPIAVLGLTTRIDVAESLEKRVRSRFSHRYVHLGLAKNFTAFQEACRSALALESDELSISEKGCLVGARQKKSPRNAFTDWNTVVDEILAHDTVNTYLRRLYYTTKSIPDFRSSLLVPFSTLPTRHPLSASAIQSHLTTTIFPHTLNGPDSKLALLPSLSTLQLALLICAARLSTIYSADGPVPFPQVYDEYKNLASKAKIQASASGALAQGAGSKVWSRSVATNAWADLCDLGLVVGIADSASARGAAPGRVDVGLEEIALAGVELGLWARWCKEI